MSITPGPGYMVDPKNPNGVIPIGSQGSVSNPNSGLITPPTTQPSPPVMTRVPGTSNTVTPSPVTGTTPGAIPAPTYTGPINNSINNTTQGNALLDSNAAQAKALGITIPGSTSPENVPTKTIPGLVPATLPTNFPAILGAGANAANTQANTGTAQEQEAYAKAQEYQKQLFDSQQAEALGIARNAAIPGVPLEFQTGRGAYLQNQYLQQQNAISTALSGEAALTGAGNTAAGQGISGLNVAAGLAAPQVTQYGQTSFNPATGTFDGGGSIPPDVMQQYAQMAATGQYAAIPTFITSNPVLNAQLNAQAKSFNPNYTPIGAQGASGVLAGIPALQSASAAADGIKNTIQTYLQQNPQLNSSDIAKKNLFTQWLQGQQFTDPKYKILFNYLDEYTNTLAPILGVGGSPSDLKTRIAQDFVNKQASGQSISDVLNTMSTLAAHKIADLQSGATGGGTTVPNAPTATATTGFAETW